MYTASPFPPLPHPCPCFNRVPTTHWFVPFLHLGLYSLPAIQIHMSPTFLLFPSIITLSSSASEGWPLMYLRSDWSKEFLTSISVTLSYYFPHNSHWVIFILLFFSLPFAFLRLSNLVPPQYLPLTLWSTSAEETSSTIHSLPPSY